ncbi:hypothetical protein [Neorhodopirellula pilleata]|nr:hypothetical protein [Neorhodopirellula pilleata]
MKSIQVWVSEETESFLPLLVATTTRACEINRRLFEQHVRTVEQHNQACSDELCRLQHEAEVKNKRIACEAMEANLKILVDMKNQIAIANKKAARDAK